MSQQPDLELLSRAERITLAIKAIKSNASLSQQHTAAVYNVPETTLQRQRAKPASERVTYPNSSRLQRHEEDTIVQYIRKLNKQGFAPTLSYVQEMANQLLAAHSGGQARVNWAYKFIRQRTEIRSQISRPRDHQRVLCSNLAVISPWFNLVRNVKAKYGILDKDTYNFNETGFQIGVGGLVKVVTASKRRLKPLSVQPGDRE
jgi:hypothetical protein